MCCTLLGTLSAACSVDTLAPESRPAVSNTCKVNDDCGQNGICTDGACYTRSGNIDEVLLEIVPDATSTLAGVSFLSMQGGLRRGDANRAVALAGPVPFPVQVKVNGEDLQDGCPYLKVGKQSVAARVQFTRVGQVGGVPMSDLSNGFTLTITTEQSSSSSAFTKNVSLVPGLYDIYAQPIGSNNCQIAPKTWRGVEVPADGDFVAWAPPETLELPTPVQVNGQVTRNTKGATLADWQVDVIDPQDGKVISTSARLGATSETSPTTNFQVTYQPTETVVPPRQSSNPGALHANTFPLVRLKPPKDTESTAPTVFWDLSGAVGGVANIELSRIPTAMQLVTVFGQVHGTNDDAVKATVKFLISDFQGRVGLPAAYGSTVATDAGGHYTTKLIPGIYHVVIVPDGATDDGTTAPGASQRQWALTELQQQAVGSDAQQMLDLRVLPTRTIVGVATAGSANTPAQGATLEATPLVESTSGVLQGVLNPPISPAKVSVPVDDTNGKFSLILDPDDYELALKPAATSNFAWWILPDVTVVKSDTPGQVGTVDPQLLYPVPVRGTISVGSQPLRNATVRAYAPRPGANSVTQVGTARTDDMGRYYLALPPGFAGSP